MPSYLIYYIQRIEDVVSIISQLRLGGMSVHRNKSRRMPHRISCSKTIIRDIVECFIVIPSDMKYFLILTKKTNIYIWNSGGSSSSSLIFDSTAIWIPYPSDRTLGLHSTTYNSQLFHVMRRKFYLNHKLTIPKFHFPIAGTSLIFLTICRCLETVKHQELKT